MASGRLLQILVPADEKKMLTNSRDAFRGQSTPPNILPFHESGIISYYCEIKTRRFCDIRLQKMSWPSNLDQRSRKKVIGKDTYRSATCDFLLTFHSNYLYMGLSRTVSEINGEFSRKLSNFPTRRVFCLPMTGFPLEFGIGARGQRNRNDGATMGIYISFYSFFPLVNHSFSFGVVSWVELSSTRRRRS